MLNVISVSIEPGLRGFSGLCSSFEVAMWVLSSPGGENLAVHDLAVGLCSGKTGLNIFEDQMGDHPAFCKCSISEAYGLYSTVGQTSTQINLCILVELPWVSKML